jgi:hypothetical protein
MLHSLWPVNDALPRRTLPVKSQFNLLIMRINFSSSDLLCSAQNEKLTQKTNENNKKSEQVKEKSTNNLIYRLLVDS